MRLLRFFPIICLLLVISISLALRFQLILTRYFDPDEFAFMHWSFLLSAGRIPYRDFFMNFTPLYCMLLSPVFSLLPPGTSALVSARIWEFTIFILVTGTAGWISYVVSKKHLLPMLLAILFFLIFPVTFDKTLEIRPDMFMTLLYFIGFALLLQSNRRPLRVFLSGMLIGGSVAVLQKIIFGLPAVFLLLLVPRQSRIRSVVWFISGFLCIPLLLLFSLQLLGILSFSWENIINGSMALKAGEGSFSAIKTLSPYQLIYLRNAGISFPWLFSTMLWITGMFGLVYITCKEKMIGISLLLFIAGSILSVYFFPTPYVQYFIPASVVISISVAYIVWQVHRATSNTVIRQVMIIVFIALSGISFFLQYRERSLDANSEQLSVIASVVAHTKPDDTFFDMVGSYVFRPDGYYICCNEYAGFADKLNPKPLSLRNSLIRNQTKFLVMDRIGKVFWLPLPEDLAFILTSYLPSPLYNKIYTLGVDFRCDASICIQYTLHGQPAGTEPADALTIPILETYRLETDPDGMYILLDGRKIADAEDVLLHPAVYSFQTPIGLTRFTLKLTPGFR